MASSSQTQLTQEQLTKMFSKFKELNLIDLTINKDSIVSTFTKEDLKKYIKDISKPASQKKLREISRALYITSPHYRSLVNYYSTLYNFDYIVEGYDIDPSKTEKEKYKKSYFKSVSYFEKMNIKHESLKVRINAYLDGVFYGFARPSKNGFYIQQLNPDHCVITYINYETGLFGYSFDFSIFRGKEKLLENYPDEFTTIYNGLKNKKVSDYWVQVNYTNAICIKTSPWNHPVPPLVGLFEGILDIADFKALNKGNEEVGNYKLLFQQIPMKEGKDAQRDEFLISEDFVQIFHANIESSLPPQIGLLTTPMKVEAVKFEKDSVDKNKVGEATSQYWNESGVSELLFGNNTTSAALKYSIQADETTLVALVREFERWVNEYNKSENNGIYKFRIRILDTTKFNIKDYFDTRLMAAQYGIPVKNELIAILGMQPSSMYVNAYLENDVLELTNNLIPLSSSHTQNGDPINKGGAPIKDEGQLTDAGLKSKENDVNAK